MVLVSCVSLCGRCVSVHACVRACVCVCVCVRACSRARAMSGRCVLCVDDNYVGDECAMCGQCVGDACMIYVGCVCDMR